MPTLSNNKEQREFILVETDELFGSGGEEPTKIVVNRASSKLIAYRKKRVYEILLGGGGRAELAKLEIYLTLADCNIKNHDDHMLFTFEDDHVADLNEFNAALVFLPNQVVDEIHKCVLTINEEWEREWGPFEKISEEFIGLIWGIQSICDEISRLDPDVLLSLSLIKQVNNEFEEKYEWSTEKSYNKLHSMGN